MVDEIADHGGNSGANQGLRHRTIGGILWITCGAGGEVVLRTVLFVILARLVEPKAFGIAGVALVVVNLALIFSELGIDAALGQRVKLETSHIRTAFVFAIGWGALVTCMIQLLAPVINAFFAFDGLTGVLQVMSLVPLLNNAGLTAEGLLRRALAFRRIATTSLISFSLGYGVVGVGLAYMGAGVWALAAAYVAQAGTRSAILLAVQPHAKAIMLDRAALRDLMAFGGGQTGSRLAQAIGQSIDNIIVGRWLGAESLGLYGRAYQLTSMPISIALALASVLSPVLSRIQNDLPRLAAAYCRSTALLALVTIPAVVTFMVLAPELVMVLLGPAWTGVIIPFQILTPGIFLRMGSLFGYAAVQATGAVYAAAWRQSLYAAAVCAGALIGQQWGLPGVASGVLGALFLNFILNSQLSLRVTSLSVSDFAVAHLRGLILGVLVGAELTLLKTAMRLMNATPPLVLGISAILLSFTILIILRFFPSTLFNRHDLQLLQNLASRFPLVGRILLRSFDPPGRSTSPAPEGPK